MKNYAFAALALTAVFSAASFSPSARSVRVDLAGGETDSAIGGFATESPGVSANISDVFANNVTASSVTTAAQARAGHFDGGNVTAALPFYATNQSAGDSDFAHRIGSSTGSFSPAGIDASLPVTRLNADPLAAMVNSYRPRSPSRASGGMASQSGYSRPAVGGAGVVRAAAPGYGSAAQVGAGRGELAINSNNKWPTEEPALICHNPENGVLATVTNALPDILGGYFRGPNTNVAAALRPGRFVFAFGETVDVPEPATLPLLTLGALLMLAARKARGAAGA